MKKTALLATCALAGLHSVEAPKETEGTTIERKVKKLRAPLVNEPDCSRLCLFENDNNSWCFSTTPPMLKVGWEWYTEFGQSEDPYDEDYIPVNFYRWSVEPYVEIQAYIQSLFDIERLYYNEYSVSLSKFHWNFFASLIINGEWQYCPGIGTEIDEVDLEMTLSMKFVDCYKVILKDLCDFTTNWRGYEAKWFDECDQSMDANVDLWDKTIKKEKLNTPSKGTIYPVSAEYCRALPLVGSDSTVSGIRGSDSPQTRFAKQAYEKAGAYIMANYGDYLTW